jgi:hypothetical protein
MPGGREHRQPDRADAGEIIAMPCWAIIVSWHHMSIYGTDDGWSSGQQLLWTDPYGFSGLPASELTHKSIMPVPSSNPGYN